MAITKEYRIILPITVDEYQVAQLYSVAESSKVCSSLTSISPSCYLTLFDLYLTLFDQYLTHFYAVWPLFDPVSYYSTLFDLYVTPIWPSFTLFIPLLTLFDFYLIFYLNLTQFHLVWVLFNPYLTSVWPYLSPFWPCLI